MPRAQIVTFLQDLDGMLLPGNPFFTPPGARTAEGPGTEGGAAHGKMAKPSPSCVSEVRRQTTTPGAGRRAPRAERALRPLVIFRKVCPGTRRESGSENFAIFASIAETARLRGCDTSEIFETLLTRQPERAHEILFREAAGAG